MPNIYSAGGLEVKVSLNTVASSPIWSSGFQYYSNAVPGNAGVKISVDGQARNAYTGMAGVKLSLVGVGMLTQF